MQTYCCFLSQFTFYYRKFRNKCLCISQPHKIQTSNPSLTCLPPVSPYFYSSCRVKLPEKGSCYLYFPYTQFLIYPRLTLNFSWKLLL